MLESPGLHSLSQKAAAKRQLLYLAPVYTGLCGGETAAWGMACWEGWSPENPLGEFLPITSANNSQLVCSCLQDGLSPCGGCRPPVLSFPDPDPQAARQSAYGKGQTFIESQTSHSLSHFILPTACRWTPRSSPGTSCETLNK